MAPLMKMHPHPVRRLFNLLLVTAITLNWVRPAVLVLKSMAAQFGTAWQSKTRIPAASRTTSSRARMSAQQRSRSGRLSVHAVASVERALKRVSVENLSDQEIKALLARPRIDFSSILDVVSVAWPAHQAGDWAGQLGEVACMGWHSSARRSPPLAH